MTKMLNYQFYVFLQAPPERFRSSFWVSRLNADGTDEQVGAIPNSMKAQDYLDTQGECKYISVNSITSGHPLDDSKLQWIASLHGCISRLVKCMKYCGVLMVHEFTGL